MVYFFCCYRLSVNKDYQILVADRSYSYGIKHIYTISINTTRQGHWERTFQPSQLSQMTPGIPAAAKRFWCKPKNRHFSVSLRSPELANNRLGDRRLCNPNPDRTLTSSRRTSCKRFVCRPNNCTPSWPYKREHKVKCIFYFLMFVCLYISFFYLNGKIKMFVGVQKYP